MVAGSTVAENVTTTGVLTLMPVVPSAGDIDTTVNGLGVLPPGPLGELEPSLEQPVKDAKAIPINTAKMNSHTNTDLPFLFGKLELSIRFLFIFPSLLIS
jgi:hypothetical protein